MALCRADKLAAGDGADAWLRVLPGAHAGEVAAVAAEGGVVVSAGVDGRVRFRDVGGAATSTAAAADVVALTGVALAAGGVTTLATTAAGRLIVLDARTGRQEAALRDSAAAQPAALRALALSPGGALRAVTGGDDGVVSSWDLRQTRWPVARVGGHDAPVMDLAFSPADPTAVLSAALDGSVLRWRFGPQLAADDALEIEKVAAFPLPANTVDCHESLPLAVVGTDTRALHLLRG